jgi:hypothetical protein
MMVSKNVQRRQVTDATKDSTVDPSITDPKAIQADKILWWHQDPDQQDHIRLHWYVVFLSLSLGWLSNSFFKQSGFVDPGPKKKMWLLPPFFHSTAISPW